MMSRDGKVPTSNLLFCLTNNPTPWHNKRNQINKKSIETLKNKQLLTFKNEKQYMFGVFLYKSLDDYLFVNYSCSDGLIIRLGQKQISCQLILFIF